jgi:16S rRNA (guanine966-N2)-methyltransferase
MRIISGTNKGKKLYAPEGARVRPTGDKIKEALFNIIGPIDEEALVLELFAGSGSIGIEFLARGAKHCTFVDVSRKSLSYVKKNLDLCNFRDRAKILLSDYEKAIINLSEANPGKTSLLPHYRNRRSHPRKHIGNHKSRCEYHYIHSSCNR